MKSQNAKTAKNIWITCSDPDKLFLRLSNRKRETDAELQKRFESAVKEQSYILKNKDRLISSGKIDAILDTNNLSEEQTYESIYKLIEI